MENFDKIMIESLGIIPNIDKTIQELSELSEKLRDFKTLFYSKNRDTNDPIYKQLFADIQEERVDVKVMLRRVDEIFHFKTRDNKTIEDIKTKRALSRIDIII